MISKPLNPIPSEYRREAKHPAPKDIFQPEHYDTKLEIEPQEFGGDRFTLETILDDGELVTVIGIWKAMDGRRSYELVGELPFEFRSETRRPTKPTNDISRLEVTLRPHRSNKKVYGVCQRTSSGKQIGYRYIGIARRPEC